MEICGGGEIRRYCGGYFSAYGKEKSFESSSRYDLLIAHANEAVHLLAFAYKNGPTKVELIFVFAEAVRFELTVL
jgi:hypothetical protein